VMAYQGILSALLAQMGHTGSKDILEGDYGFWRYIGAEKCDYNILLSELGKKWYVMDSSIKPYPACRWIHASLDLFAKIVKENNLKPEDIEKVVVRVHRTAVEKGSIYEPKDWLTAQVSIPYNIALVAFGITPSSEWQAPERYKNPEILSFHRKVEVEEDPDAARIISSAEQPTYGFKRASTSLEVVTASRSFKARAEYAKGDPWLPETKMSDEELRDKFRSLASRVAESSLRWRNTIEEIIEKVHNMEKMDDVSELMPLLAP
jgi:2-methylcitrate dehydratase PrpD